MRDIARLDDYRTDRHLQRIVGAEDADRSGPPEPRAPEATPSPASEPRAPETPPSERPATDPRAPETLWREALGERLRAHRTGSGRTLAETAGRAGVSPQYLSEMERGRKEPSSEMIAAVAGALGLTLTDLVGDVARHLAAPRSNPAPTGPQLLATAA